MHGLTQLQNYEQIKLTKKKNTLIACTLVCLAAVYIHELDALHTLAQMSENDGTTDKKKR